MSGISAAIRDFLRMQILVKSLEDADSGLYLSLLFDMDM